MDVLEEAVGMASDPGTFGAVLTAEVIAAIEKRWKHLGSPSLTPAAVGRHVCMHTYVAAAFVCLQRSDCAGRRPQHQEVMLHPPPRLCV